MVTSLPVSPILTVHDPAGKLRRFLDAEWELYDGAPTKQDSKLTLFDILVSIMTNSRLDTAEKVRSIWNGRRCVEDALALLPPDVALTDDDVPWDALETLFGAFCGIRYAAEAVTTKILHKKRPNLIPIVDSVMMGYFGRCRDKPLRGAPARRLVENLKIFRTQLLSCLPRIEDLRALDGIRRYRLTPVRALEILIWVELTGYYASAKDPADPRELTGRRSI
jgi:hypothetical protein